MIRHIRSQPITSLLPPPSHQTMGRHTAVPIPPVVPGLTALYTRLSVPPATSITTGLYTPLPGLSAAPTVPPVVHCATNTCHTTLPMSSMLHQNLVRQMPPPAPQNGESRDDSLHKTIYFQFLMVFYSIQLTRHHCYYIVGSCHHMPKFLLFLCQETNSYITPTLKK